MGRDVMEDGVAFGVDGFGIGVQIAQQLDRVLRYPGSDRVQKRGFPTVIFPGSSVDIIVSEGYQGVYHFVTTIA